MSIHNLDAQLAWLLSSKPFIPPPWTGPPVESAWPGLSGQSEHENSDVQLVSTEQPHVSDVTPDSPNVACASPRRCMASTSANMARLRTAPTPTKKPRLVAQNSCPNPDSSASTASRADGELPKRGYSDVSMKRIPPTHDFHAQPQEQLKTQQHWLVTASPSNFSRKERVETLDLTGDLDVSESKRCNGRKHAGKLAEEAVYERQPNGTVLGRKRKSDEYERDLHGISPSHGRAQQNDITKTSVAPEFEDVDDMIEDPPPPYSTAIPKDYTAYFSDSPTTASASRRMTEYEIQRSPAVTTNNPTSSTLRNCNVHMEEVPVTPLKGFHDESSVQDFAGKREDVNATTERSQKVQDAERTKSIPSASSYQKAVDEPIADSEEEDDLLDCRVQSPCIRASPERTITKSVSDQQSKSQSERPLLARDQNVPLSQNIDKDPTHQSVRSTPCLRIDNSATQPTDQHSPSPSAKRVRAAEPEEAPIVIFKESNELVKKFSKMPVDGLQRLLEQYEAAYLEASEAYLDALAEPERMLNMSDLKRIKKERKIETDALKSLMAAREEYSKLTRSRAAVRRSLLLVMEERDDLAEAEERKLQSVTKEWRESEANLVQLIQTAKLDSHFGESIGATQARISHVAIQSTQTPVNQPFPEIGIPDSTFVQTQLVQQTQNHNFETTTNRLTYDDRSFETVTGSPPGQTLTIEDDFGFEADEEDMLEIGQDAHANEYKERAGISPAARTPFRECSGNASRSNNHQKASEDFSKTPKPLHATSSIAGLQHRWSSDVVDAMKNRFHLRGFRPNQLDAINATLEGKDVFVLMPTGGGKSLCYQLPSILRSGNTRGVTLVISPLLSLMEDQVAHLQKLNIQALIINGSTTLEARKIILNALKGPDVEKFVQLLYVTPEMLVKNQIFINALRGLHKRKLLARIVIDEAHCVSQWGHDFRPDYKNLGEIRKDFEGVPAMALTATATENVKADVIHNLNIVGCKVFTQSFNRPNLTYEVFHKGKANEMMQDIAEKINTKHKNQSGIIYCLSRKTCEQVAQTLRTEHRIRAQHYHALMEADEKSAVQKEWQSGQVHVIVATIAFGMGIDKPDVRFVMHHSIPKSLEGYYQETGRAGRDGKRSSCYLYYGYQDCAALKRMIDDGEGSDEQKSRQHNMLRNVVAFCENKTDCRRVQVLAYFNELFKKEHCFGSCDNCNSTSTFEIRDFTQIAGSALRLVKQMQSKNVTILQCADALRGLSTKKILEIGFNDLSDYGAGSEMDRNELERLFCRLLSEGALSEENIVNRKGFANQYVFLGPNSNEFLRGRRRVDMQIRVSSARKVNKRKEVVDRNVKKKAESSATTRQAQPTSTNVSSPIQGASNRRANRQILLDDEDEESESSYPTAAHLNGYERDEGFVVSDDEDDEDAFEPVRIAGQHRKVKQKPLSDPIIADPQLGNLSSLHKMVVEDFLADAKQESKRVVYSKGLRQAPFTDTTLRAMAISFPQSKEELLEIPGIDPEKVQLHGERFLAIIKKHYTNYLDIMREEEERPNDPNHQNVVDLVSDDDEVAKAVDECDWEFSQEETSPHFSQSADVSAFNRQFQQAQGQRAPAQNANTAALDSERAGKRTSTWMGKKPRKGGRTRAASNGPNGAPVARGITRKASTAKRSTSAVQKKSKNNATTAGAGGAGRKTRPGAGPGRQQTLAGGGIGMMPT